MDETLRVPENLSVPPGASAEHRESVEAVNVFLGQMRRKLKKLSDEVERLGNVRGNMFIHNGPNGIIIGG